jgi:acetyltransferase-like isoleucine patch superfamily enzyme
VIRVGEQAVLTRDIEIADGVVVAAGTTVNVYAIYGGDDTEYSVAVPSKPEERFIVRWDEVEAAGQ